MDTGLVSKFVQPKSNLIRNNLQLESTFIMPKGYIYIYLYECRYQEMRDILLLVGQ